MANGSQNISDNGLNVIGTNIDGVINFIGASFSFNGSQGVSGTFSAGAQVVTVSNGIISGIA